ncbi:unnamed protein product [Pleuronectes platessa]|uniref:Uncharacterized protein n=1 Tax=Pleuronectes platessa TaxID=8262 RepID=A0A9N7VMA5_PLEPL|nr:unnamed protein product [Pleuronectes platessa]
MRLFTEQNEVERAPLLIAPPPLTRDNQWDVVFAPEPPPPAASDWPARSVCQRSPGAKLTASGGKGGRREEEEESQRKAHYSRSDTRSLPGESKATFPRQVFLPSVFYPPEKRERGDQRGPTRPGECPRINRIH